MSTSETCENHMTSLSEFVRSTPEQRERIGKRVVDKAAQLQRQKLPCAACEGTGAVLLTATYRVTCEDCGGKGYRL
jgi:DnaJ-class molecular chaperone